MAAISTPQWSNTSTPQLRLTVTENGSTGNIAKLDWKLEYVAHGYAASTGSIKKSYSAVINGATVASGSYDINGKTGIYTIASGTKEVAKATSAKSIPFSCSMAFNLTWSGVYGGTKSASGSLSIPAITSHTLTYNANGGTGAPGKQTKWYGSTIKISTVKPTRTGYTFQGWGLSSDTTTVRYNPGDTFGSDTDTTLYAVWKADTYTVSYDANGGTGAPGNQTKTYGVNLTLSSTKPTRTNYTFKGWGTSAASTTVAYASGASYTANAAIMLYAIWELAYTAPVISNVQIDRSDSDGTLNDDGKYGKVSFDWQLDTSNSGGVQSIKIQYKKTSGGSYINLTETASGTSGSVSRVFGSGVLDVDSTYDVLITVSDAKGSSQYHGTLAATKYIMDFSPQGGVGFGRPAPAEQTVSFNVPVVIDGMDMFFKSGFGMYFQDAAGENSMSLVRGTSVDRQLIWTLNQLYLTGSLCLESHLYLDNDIGVAGKLTSGSYSSMLKMNASNQVELNWTSGGLRGRVRKQLWAGTWTSGSLTLAELPYYNMFMFAFSGSNADDAEHGYLIGIRDATGKRISGIGAINGAGDIRLVTVDLTVDGTKITYDSSRFVVITGGNALSAHAGGRKIRRIVGLF
mgnify:CR=1 FL=1